MKQRLIHILFWSVLPTAFIGPGSNHHCGIGGVEFGYILMWALVFSTGGCIILREAATRLRIISGQNPGGLLSGGSAGRR